MKQTRIGIENQDGGLRIVNVSKVALVLILAVSLFACSDKRAQLEPSVSAATIASAKSKWREFDSESYSFVYRRYCDCPTNGLILVTHVNSGEVKTYDPLRIGQEQVPVSGGEVTFGQVFDYVEDALNKNFVLTSLAIDPEFGYIRQFRANHETSASSFVGFEVLSFRPHNGALEGEDNSQPDL